MTEFVDDGKIEEIGKVIGAGIEDAFNRAENMLREMAVNMKRNYEEHKDEIDAIVEKHRLERERLQASMPKILVGDIIRTCSQWKCYEVDVVEENSVVSNSAGFRHRNNSIVAVYRFDGNDFKSIWEREDYMKFKNSCI